MILMLFTDNDNNLKELFTSLAKKKDDNVNYIVSEMYANSVEDIDSRNDICVIADSENNNMKLKELIETENYQIVMIQNDNAELIEYLEGKGIGVYCKKTEDNSSKYDRLKKQYDELFNQFNSNKDYLQSLTMHATNLDLELQQYKKLYDGDNAQLEMKKLQKQRDEYLGLYRDLLDKLDELTIENLNYKKKGK